MDNNILIIEKFINYKFIQIINKDYNDETLTPDIIKEIMKIIILEIKKELSNKSSSIQIIFNKLFNDFYFEYIVENDYPFIMYDVLNFNLNLVFRFKSTSNINNCIEYYTKNKSLYEINQTQLFNSKDPAIINLPVAPVSTTTIQKNYTHFYCVPGKIMYDSDIRSLQIDDFYLNDTEIETNEEINNLSEKIIYGLPDWFINKICDLFSYKNKNHNHIKIIKVTDIPDPINLIK